MQGDTILDNVKMQSVNLSAWFGAKQALKDINITLKENAITAIIGPSGCGKSTFIRTLNRMHLGFALAERRKKMRKRGSPNKISRIMY